MDELFNYLPKWIIGGFTLGLLLMGTINVVLYFSDNEDRPQIKGVLWTSIGTSIIITAILSIWFLITN